MVFRFLGGLAGALVSDDFCVRLDDVREEDRRELDKPAKHHK